MENETYRPQEKEMCGYAHTNYKQLVDRTTC